MSDIQHFHPKKLPVELDPGKFTRELAQAKYDLGSLNGAHQTLENEKLLGNPTLLIAPLTAKEAAVSSKIEGTQSNASDVFYYEASGEERQSDTAEVANYRKAIMQSIGELNKGRELSQHLLKSIHETLLHEVRHQGKLGDYREDVVYIAEKRSDPIEEALYIPPEPYLVPEYMDNLWEYLKSEEEVLIKIGIAHYQFEAIHPFEDGNGRIGRMLIPLTLFYEGELPFPIVYLSGYFERNRDKYISALHSVDTTEDYEEWLSFFFKAISAQSKQTQSIIDEIYSLYNKIRSEFETKSPYLIPFIEFAFRNPVFTIPQATETLECSRKTIERLLAKFKKRNFVLKINLKKGRTHFYAFKDLLEILE